MDKIILNIGVIIMLISIIISIYRFIKGPTVADRVVSFDVITIISIALIAIIAHLTNRVIYMDVSVVYGLLSFLGVLVVARYLEGGL